VRRRRIAVALLFDRATTATVDELRRSAGVEDVVRIAPHITLVPPIDLQAEHLDPLLPMIAATAAASSLLHLTLGPVDTFAPRTMTIHLAVAGDLHALGRLRDELAVAPLAQRGRWPFVPHVTIREDAPLELIEHWQRDLPLVHIEARVDAVHVLEHLPRPGGGRNWWQPVARVPLGPT
jgi:2'-5' RNA ligase